MGEEAVGVGSRRLFTRRMGQADKARRVVRRYGGGRWGNPTPPGLGRCLGRREARRQWQVVGRRGETTGELRPGRGRSMPTAEAGSVQAASSGPYRGPSKAFRKKIVFLTYYSKR
jgi:hypothetical protein